MGYGDMDTIFFYVWSEGLKDSRAGMTDVGRCKVVDGYTYDLKAQDKKAEAVTLKQEKWR